MTDQTESASEYAQLLWALDYGAKNGGLIAGRSGAAIRALEAKVRELEHQRDTHYVAKPFYNSIEKQLYDACADRDRTQEQNDFYSAEHHAMQDRLAAALDDRDRLAGEVERLTTHVGRLEHANDTAFAEVARLTSELAAARENEARYLWLKDNAYLWPTMPCTSVDQAERCGLWLDDERVDIDAEIDAARRAGEGEA